MRTWLVMTPYPCLVEIWVVACVCSPWKSGTRVLYRKEGVSRRGGAFIRVVWDRAESSFIYLKDFLEESVLYVKPGETKTIGVLGKSNKKIAGK